MQKQKNYAYVRFSADTLRQATETFFGKSADLTKQEPTLSVEFPNHKWYYDTLEEFYGGYRQSRHTAFYWLRNDNMKLEVCAFADNSLVSIVSPDRSQIEAAFEVFEAAAPGAMLPQPKPKPAPKPTIFIGHGRSSDWRDVKDHLQDKHGYTVIAYESGARAGHTIRDILADMLTESSFAILCLTAEDQTGDGKRRARQNVIHETGLFQGRLGFHRAILLVESGVELFSNVQGVHQQRYETGNVAATFGEILATLRCEFGEE